MDTEVYYKFPKDLMRSCGYISKVSGKVATLTPLGKIVYVYMMARNEFFVNKLSGEHYETQGTIADACGSDYQAVGRILRSFIDNGVLAAVKLRPDGVGQWRWIYRDIKTDLELVYKEVKPVPDEKVMVVVDTPRESWEDEFLDGLGG